MNKFFKITILSLFLSLIIIPVASPIFVHAQEVTPVEIEAPETNNRMIDRMRMVGNIGGYDTTDGGASVPVIVGTIINAILSIVGLVFLILTVFAGFNWMTSQGNQEKVKKSTDTLKSSVIGLIVTLSAWTIWNFIFANLIL